MRKGQLLPFDPETLTRAIGYVGIFIFFNFIGAVLWVIGLSVGGFFLGSMIPDVDRYLLPIIVLIIIVSIAPSAFHIRKTNRHELAIWVRQRLGRTA